LQNKYNKFYNILIHNNQYLKNKISKGNTLLLWVSSITVMCLLIIGLYFIFSQNNSTKTILAQTYNVKQDITLLDGTNVTLNTNTILYEKEGFDSKHRIIYLHGEAYFEVAHDSEHPFVVVVNDTKITVLGTHFNVFQDTIKKLVFVSVNEGKVKVQIKNREQTITKGQQIIINVPYSSLQKTSCDVNSNSWKTGLLQFKDEPITRVLKSVNKHFNVHFEIGNKELKKCRVNASFRDSDSTQIAQLLSHMLKAEVKNENGKQIFYSISSRK